MTLVQSILASFSKSRNASRASLRLLSVIAATITLSSCGGLPEPTHLTTGPHFLGEYQFQIENNQLSVVHVNEPNHILWRTAAHGRLLTARETELAVKDSRSSYTIKENSTLTCHGSQIDSVSYQVELANTDNNLEKLIFSGRYLDCEDLTFDLTFQLINGQLQFNAATSSAAINHLSLSYEMDATERVYGFGEQFTFLNLNGRDVPVLTQEQGIGRGEPILSTLVNIVANGSSGNPVSSYYAVPHYLTNQRRSLFLENVEYSRFDLRAAEEAIIHSFSGQLTGRILTGETLLQLITAYTEFTGRMKTLPDWVHQGAILGLQGGTGRVSSIVDSLLAVDTPITALWLQDWVGKRQTLGGLGSQLWWNWELDQDQYPGWSQWTQDLAAQQIRTLGYINPFLVDVSEKTNAQSNLYQQALALDYLVKNEDGEPFPVTITDFDAGIVDLTNEDARTWLKEIIKTQLIGNGFSGWMADFGEALPFETHLSDGRDGFEFHNVYPVEWAKLNAEAVAEAGLTEDITFFMRSGFSQSPGYSTLFWLGDQAVTWDEYDGLRSALIGLLNGGFSGLSLNHSDIGGYTSLAIIGNLGLVRSESLLLRWIEANAFSAIYRTHEGLAPDANKQVYSNEKLRQHFARFGQVFQVFFDYRKKLFQEAEELGYPVVRHPILHYPQDQTFLNMTADNLQFMLGADFMVAPVTSAKVTTKEVYLPQGQWVNLWNGTLMDVSEVAGITLNVDAPIGQPPVFYRADSSAAQSIRAELLARGLAENTP